MKYDDKAEKTAKELEDFLEEKIKEVTGGKIDLKVMPINRETAYKLLDELTGSKDLLKISECLPCLLNAFMDLTRKHARGDYYCGAVVIATLMTCMVHDIENRTDRYTKGLTLTLLKFADVFNIIDTLELKKIKAKEFWEMRDRVFEEEGE